jgi:hypothetical protein
MYAYWAHLFYVLPKSKRAHYRMHISLSLEFEVYFFISLDRNVPLIYSCPNFS